MTRKLNAGKAQKMNLMLAQAVTAMRVNERLTCRLLRWAASHSEDPRSFIEKTMEEARNDLRRAGEEGSTTSTLATNEALEYLDDLAIEIDARRRRKRSPRTGDDGEIDAAAGESEADGSLWQQ